MIDVAINDVTAALELMARKCDEFALGMVPAVGGLDYIRGQLPSATAEHLAAVCRTLPAYERAERAAAEMALAASRLVQAAEAERRRRLAMLAE